MKVMKIINIALLATVGVASLSMLGVATGIAVNGMNSNQGQNQNIEDDEEDLTGVTSVKIINGPLKTVYQEGELFEIDGLMCLVTQNGTKKIAKTNFVVLDTEPLRAGQTSVRVSYGDFEFTIPIKVIEFVSVLDITHNGAYIVEAEDPRIPLDGYIEADPAWSEAHYDGVNQVTKFVETWTNSRTIPSSGRSLANIAKGSVLGFKFTVSKDCYININAVMAMYDTKKPAELLEFRLDGVVRDEVDKNLVLTHLDASDAGAMYFNWQNWSMGNYFVEAGQHSFTITVVDFKLPNLDCFKIVATGMEDGDAININQNGTIKLAATDPILDRSGWIKDSDNYDFEETWENSGATYVSETTGRSIGHLQDGSQIVVPIGSKGRAHVLINLVVAHIDAKKVTEYLRVTLDSTNFNKEDFNQDTDLTLGESSASHYWKWKCWRAGELDMTKGSHILTIGVKKGLNIHSIEVVVSNYQDGENGVFTINNNGTYSVEAESGLLDRTFWSIREDFINAGRDPVEPWTTNGPTALNNTSGRSLCGLNNGCVIDIPFESLGNFDLRFEVICAYSTEVKPSVALKIELDDEVLPDNDTDLVVSQTSASTYWSWNMYNGGSSQIQKGEHNVRVTLVNATINIDSFRIISTNYSV